MLFLPVRILAVSRRKTGPLLECRRDSRPDAGHPTTPGPRRASANRATAAAGMPGRPPACKTRQRRDTAPSIPISAPRPRNLTSHCPFVLKSILVLLFSPLHARPVPPLPSPPSVPSVRPRFRRCGFQPRPNGCSAGGKRQENSRAEAEAQGIKGGDGPRYPKGRGACRRR